MMQRSASDAGSVPGSRQGRWHALPDELVAMRTALQGWLVEFGLDAAAEHMLVVAVNEAASNAVEHAYRAPMATSTDGHTFDVSLDTEPGWLCLEITDRGIWRSPGGPSGERGLGIPLMHQLVDSVTIDKDERGTRVVLRHRLVNGKRHRYDDSVAPL